MKQALTITLLLFAGFSAIRLGFGFTVASSVGFAVVALIALLNGATFVWLWHVRATSLALGMALNWSGQAAISLWWLLASMNGGIVWIGESHAIFAFIALYVVGGGLHLAVIQRSTEMREMALIWPLILVVGIVAGALAA